MGRPILDITGEKFGKLTVIEFAGVTTQKKAKWLCLCECGNHKIVQASQLKAGNVKSCGCLYKQVWESNGQRQKGKASHLYKHGLSESRLNSIYRKIKQRCLNKNDRAYNHYGGRGITICEQWKNDFLSFYKWAMENGYSQELSIDRIDVDGNYCPENCRWVDAKTQQNNRTNNVRIAYAGEEHTIAEWSRITGVSKSALYHRYERGQDVGVLLQPYSNPSMVLSDELSETDRGDSGFGSTGK